MPFAHIVICIVANAITSWRITWLQMKRKHLTVRQMVGEAMANVRCTGSGEWVDPAGKLVYVDEVHRASAGKPQQGKVQDTLRRFYAGRIGAPPQPATVSVSYPELIMQARCARACRVNPRAFSKRQAY